MWRQLRGGAGRVVLRSAGADCWSFCGSDPEFVIESRYGVTTLRGRAGVVEESRGSPLAALTAWVNEYRHGCTVLDGPQPIAMGYMGYDLGAIVLPKLGRRHSGIAPDMWFGLYPAVTRQWGTRSLEVLQSRSSSVPSSHGRLGAPPRVGVLAASREEDIRYRQGVRRALQYIKAGDVYQVNLSRKLVAPVIAPGDSMALHQHLCRRETVDYSAAIDTGNGAVVSLSPELFVKFDAESGRVRTCPIKGTRPRGNSASRDRWLASDLEADPKDGAEHLMIVDLERNDLGRIAKVGSVEVTDLRRVVALPSVHHMISTVECVVRNGVGLAEVLAATFPGGSITGAPKLRAMQIIDEIEGRPRGPYTGAVGYFDARGGMTLSIAIRTAVMNNEHLELSVGGGIVADSSVDAEFDETEAKAEGWRRGLAALSRLQCAG